MHPPHPAATVPPAWLYAMRRIQRRGVCIWFMPWMKSTVHEYAATLLQEAREEAPVRSTRGAGGRIQRRPSVAFGVHPGKAHMQTPTMLASIYRCAVRRAREGRLYTAAQLRLEKPEGKLGLFSRACPHPRPPLWRLAHPKVLEGISHYPLCVWGGVA